DRVRMAEEQEMGRGAALPGECGPRHNHLGTRIATHRVDCDPRPLSHRSVPPYSRAVGYLLRLGLEDFTPLIMTAARAEVVREAELAAIRAFLIPDRLQRIVAAAHIALGGRGFSLGDGHRGTCS